MRPISYEAPAKVILTGEHAVVYGKPALVCALDINLTATLNGKHAEDGETDAMLQKVISTVYTHLGISKPQPVSIQISSSIPVGRGLGSSAALSVAVSACLIHYYAGKKPKADEVNNCAYRVEKLFHSNPSGVDVSASTFGGLIFYRKEFEFLKNISRLQSKIPEAIKDSLFLIDSGKPHETTGEMVRAVGELYNKRTGFAKRRLENIERITKTMTVSLVGNNQKLFSDCVRQNEIELESLGVVSGKTKKLISSLSKFGDGKVTGAGGKREGSGYVLFTAHNRKETEEYLMKHKIDYLPVCPTYTGYRQI